MGVILWSNIWWLQFNIELNGDHELIHEAHEAHGADAGKVIVNRFVFWVPRLTPKDSMYDKFVSSFLRESHRTYMKEMYEMSASTAASGFFQISASIDNVTHNWHRNVSDHRQAENSPYMKNTFDHQAVPHWIIVDGNMIMAFFIPKTSLK